MISLINYRQISGIILTASAAWARERRLHAPLEWGKKLGLKRVFTGGPPADELSAEQHQRLLDTYEEDITWLEKRLNRDFSKWREIQDTSEGKGYQQT